MIFRQLTAGGDWEFGKGISSYAKGERAIELNIKTRLLSWVSDCFFAMQDGIDWRSRLDVGQEAELKDELKTAILQSYGVVSIDNVDVTRDAQRQVTVEYSINTIYGQMFSRLVTGT